MSIQGFKPTLNLNFTTDEVDPRVVVSCSTSTGSRTRWNSKGILERVPPNTPRIDYHPVLRTPMGLMSEEGRINSQRNGETIGASNGVIGAGGALPTNYSAPNTGGLTWTISNANTTDSRGVTGFDLLLSGTTGSTEAELMFETSTAIVQPSLSRWTGSALVNLKSGTLTNINSMNIRMVPRDITGVSVGTAIDTTFTPTNEYQRFSNSIVTPAGSARLNHSLVLKFNSGVAVSVQFRIGMVQLERGYFATSYIPTSTGAVSRPNENITFPLVDWWNPNEGSFIVQTVPTSIDTSAAVSQRLLVLTDSSNLNGHTIRKSGSNYRLNGEAYVNSSTASFNLSLDNIGTSISVCPASVGFKLGYSYSTSTAGLTRNALTIKTTTAALSLPLSSQTLILGSDVAFTSGGHWSGWIQQVQFYPFYMDYGELSKIVKNSYAPNNIY